MASLADSRRLVPWERGAQASKRHDKCSGTAPQAIHRIRRLGKSTFSCKTPARGTVRNAILTPNVCSVPHPCGTEQTRIVFLRPSTRFGYATTIRRRAHVMFAALCHSQWSRPDRDTYRAWAVTRCTSLRGIALRCDVSHRNGRLQSWGPHRNPGHRGPETPIRHSAIRIMPTTLPIRNPAPSRRCHSTSSNPHANNQVSPWMTS